MTKGVYKQIGSIIFGVLSPEIIKKTSATKIITAELYDKDGYPVDGGLMDVSLGVIDPGLRCRTCGGKIKSCIGHFGYIELARPVAHIKYIKTILDILRGTCKECGKVMITEDKIKTYLSEIKTIKNIESKRKKISEFIRKSALNKKCPYCKAYKYKVTLEKPTNFIEYDKKLSPIEIRARLEKLSDETVELFGLNPRYSRPEWFILTILPIPPVTIRPSITLETGERSEDDLTHKLGDIVRINQRLFENINAGAPEIIVEDLWDLLQYHVTTYFDNTVTQIPPARHRSGQPLKTISERIKSKEGRFRHNLAGKRVNFSARTVISPDPNLRFNEVGVPKEIAIELTIPERVTEWNIERLKKFVERGPSKYPGANYVILSDGKKKKISPETKEQLFSELEPGCIVERHLINKDIVLFNRQPSLHRMSIMSHKVKVLPGRSFRLNPAVCTPYNADFDGDEMNLHVPQNEEARAEAEILMQVQTQIISPKNGLNIVGCIEDAITGNYLLTKNLSFKKESAIDLLLSIGITDLSRLKNSPDIIDGKKIFSVLLPKDFNLIAYSGKGEEEEVIIKNGEIKSGFIDKALIGEENGALIRSLYAKYNEDEAISILNKIFKLGVAVLFRIGFTTAISDSDLPQDVAEKCNNLIKESEKKVYDLIDRFNNNKLEILPGRDAEESLEIEILEILSNVRNEIGKVISQNVKETNPTIIMFKSGATGNLLNLAQIAANVGQQSLRGKRIGIGYTNRTLSFYEANNLSPEARGFIRHGYKKGLSPVEFFYGAMTGRDSLMDTALRTPKSGYLYRRLANAFQDLKVEYDGTIRDANKTIVQFLYGEDNIDVSKSEGGVINTKKIIKNIVGGSDG